MYFHSDANRLEIRSNSLSPRLRKLLIIFTTFALSGCDETEEKESIVEEYPVYSKSDLGWTFGKSGMTLKVWSPKAKSVKLNLYKEDFSDQEPIEKLEMFGGEHGVWTATLTAEKAGMFYTIQAEHVDGLSDEVPDPYAKAVGRNGKRGHLINPKLAMPEGWTGDVRPDFSEMKPNDFLIYEVHVRDFSISENSGVVNRGKFMAFTERGTRNAKGHTTGLGHLMEMGVTHVHLLPVFDFITIDESRLDSPQYNWGYDPQNFNVPEGSYSSNPANGAVRIKEFKALVLALHEVGIGVVMDVVYNHTFVTSGLAFEEMVQGYYYRRWKNGRTGNGSGCGNEMDSEKPMMRKFMIDSLKYWAQEFHIDGFRFDLMALHDMETMKQVERELRQINPSVLLYGEGWTAGKSPLPPERRATKTQINLLPGIAAYCDEIRDGLKGDWRKHKAKGFVSGNFSLREGVKFGIVGAVDHPQIDYSKVENANAAWAVEPFQCINYVSCHDNHTLYDKLWIANPHASEKEIREMHLLSNFVVLTSQGIPFLHAGVEFLRTKGGVENSYKSPDNINQLDWDEKSRNIDHVKKYRALIKIRHEHPSFRLGAAHEVRRRLVFLDSPKGIIAYQIKSPKEDEWKRAMVVVNAKNTYETWNLSKGEWKMVFPVGNQGCFKVNLAPRQGYIFAERR